MSSRIVTYQREAEKFAHALVRCIGDCLLTVAKTSLAFASEERCRICDAYIDMLDWLNEFAPTDAAVAARLNESQQSMAICDPCWKNLMLTEPIMSRFDLDNPEVLIANVDAGEYTNIRRLPVYSGIAYTEQVRKLVRSFKYDRDLLLTIPLSLLAMRAVVAEPNELKDLVLVPVPLHWRRKHQRGYNQATLIAKALSKHWQASVCEAALARKRFTKPQNKLTKSARQDNLNEAFQGNAKLVRGKNIVLIDDVCTSGATLIECAREAYRCGAETVAALTVARAVLRLGADSADDNSTRIP